MTKGKEEKVKAACVLKSVLMRLGRCLTSQTEVTTSGCACVCVCVFTPCTHTHKPLNYVLDDSFAPRSRPEVLRSISERERVRE